MLEQKIKEKGQELSNLQKKIAKLENSYLNLRKKEITSKFYYLLDSNKWDIVNFLIEVNYYQDNCDSLLTKSEIMEREDRQYIMSISQKIQNTDLSNTSSGFVKPAIGISPILKKIKKGKIGKSKAIRLSKKYSLNTINSKNFKSYQDFYNYCEKIDVNSITINNCHVKFEYNNVAISAKEKDDLFKFVKNKKISLSLDSFVRDIEESESLLKKKKELFSEISSNMLFNLS